MRVLLFSLLLLAACATAPAGGLLNEMRALEAQRGEAIHADNEAAL